MNNLFLAKGAPPEKVKIRRCTPHGIGDTQKGHSKGNRVGGGVAPAVLPHHRAYGSVHGGSQSVLKAPAPVNK
jgi:hypothetical protein